LDFSGTWSLDLNASASLEPIMKKVGAGLLEREFASRTHLKATIHQTEHCYAMENEATVTSATDKGLKLSGKQSPYLGQFLPAISSLVGSVAR
jgi:hypothetical protein